MKFDLRQYIYTSHRVRDRDLVVRPSGRRLHIVVPWDQRAFDPTLCERTCTVHEAWGTLYPYLLEPGIESTYKVSDVSRWYFKWFQACIEACHENAGCGLIEGCSITCRVITSTYIDRRAWLLPAAYIYSE